VGTLAFGLQGTVITDSNDMRATHADLDAELTSETCDWLTAPVVAWFQQAVQYAVCVEFDRYIEAGDLARTKERMAKLQTEIEARGGHVGMYL
jgi:hypothetical protein